MQCSAVQYRAVWYSAVQYSILHCSKVQCSTVQYSGVYYCAVQRSVVHFRAEQYCVENNFIVRGGRQQQQCSMGYGGLSPVLRDEVLGQDGITSWLPMSH